MITYLFVFAFTLALILPTLLVVMVGQWLHSRLSQSAQAYSLTRYYLIAYVLIAVPYAIFSLLSTQSSVGPFLLLVLPALDGLLALLLINWRPVLDYWQAERRTASILLLALLAVILVTVFSRPQLAMLLVFPPVLAALVWLIGTRLEQGWLVILAIILIAALTLDSLGIAGNHAIYSQDSLRSAYQVASRLITWLALVLAAIFVHQTYQDFRAAPDSVRRERKTGRRNRVSLIMAALLLLSIAAVTFRQGLLASATGRAYEDHLPLVTLSAGLAVSLVLAFNLPESARRARVAVILLVPAVLVAAYSMGWQVDYESVTASRADRLNQAISQYQLDNGRYPRLLADLTPGYLPLIFGPLTGRGQTWCYQSGSDYYRLGYVYYQRYYEYPDNTPFWDPYFEIKVPYSIGQPPEGPWICDQELELFKKHRGL